MRFPNRNFRLALACLLFSTTAATATVTTLTVPTSVIGDATGGPTGPWSSDGITALELRFDASSVIPGGSTINSVTIQVTGEAIAPSYRSEIALQLSSSGSLPTDWDFGDQLGMANSAGTFDTGILNATEVTGPAGVLYRVIITDDVDDPGIDCRIDSVTLVIDYDERPSDPIGAYLNGVFPSSDPTDGGAQPPATLSLTGAFSNLADLTPTTGLLAYDVISPLWSDGATKRRWLAVPGDGFRNTPGEKIELAMDGPWTFPTGSVAVKHFELPVDQNNPSAIRRLETRFVVITDGDHYGVTYRWRADGSDADLLPDSATEIISVRQTDGSIRGQRWDYPGRADCRTCHNTASGPMLGIKTYQLNFPNLQPGETVTRNRLKVWEGFGMFTEGLPVPSDMPLGHALDDISVDPGERINSYLATNCGNCHYPDNLSNDFDLRFQTSLGQAEIIDDPPLYDLGIHGARVITPLDPSSSVMYSRMNTRGAHKMPPIGRNETHTEAVDVLAAWINTLEPDEDGTNPPIANDDQGYTVEGQTTYLPLLINDIDPDGQSYFYRQWTQPSNGAAYLSGENMAYIPNPGFIGTDVFTYQIIDSTGLESDFATVTVVVSHDFGTSLFGLQNRSNLLPDPTDAGGVAIGVVDMNQDGYDDIVHFNVDRELHIEYQQPDGSGFTRNALGVASTARPWGVAIGDADNNGMPDIVSGGYYDGLHYYRANSAGNSYTKTVLDTPSIFLQAINFADINMDGWLDIFACHDDGHSAKFRNLGNGAMIADTAMMDTTTQQPSDNSGNYGSVWTDYDNDGDLDLYVTKCRSGASSPTDPRRINQLFQNDGSGNYTETGLLASGEQSWTSDFADIDNDGDLDCFIGNHTGNSQVMENLGDGTFSDVTATSGVDVTWRVIQSIFRDFNNDGWVDLLLVGEEDAIYINDRDGTFQQRPSPFVNVPTVESCAVGDLNHDGFPDVYASFAHLYNFPTATRPDKLFLSSPNGNGFLSVTLVGRASNRLASGARLELHGPWGIQVREVRSGEGYGITNSFSQRFGMGNVPLADKLVVRWPSGTVDTAFGLAANQFKTLKEGGTQLPVLQAPGTQTSDANTSVQLQIIGTDPTSDPLTYNAINLPTGLSIDPVSGLISGTTANASGTFPVTVSASDNWSTTSVSFSWQVLAPPNPRPDVALTTTSATVHSSFNVNANFTEPVTGLALSDFVISNGAGGNFAGSGSSYTFTVTPITAGLITLRLPADSVTDSNSQGNTVSNLLSVTFSGSTGEITPDADTIALFHFNGNYEDASTNNFDLTSAGGVQLFNDTARFTAIGDTLSVNIPDNLVLPEPGNPLVIDAKIFPRSWLAYSVDNLPVISMAQEWNSYLALEDKKWGSNPRGPEVQSSNGTVATAAQWASAVTIGQWNRIQIIFDGSDKVELFVEGLKISEATLPPDIGRTNDWILTLGNFDGDLDEVHVSRAIPASGPDETPPAPVLATASVNVSGAFPVGVDFGETVSGFDAGDVIINNATLSGFSGSDAAYQFTLTPIAEGTITVEIPAGIASDNAGNQSIASDVLAVNYTQDPGGNDEYTPDADTIALYHLNGNASDASTNGFDLTDAGTVQYSNNAASFNAIGDQLTVNIPDSLVLPSGGQPFTLEARILPRAWLAWSIDNIPVISFAQEWDSHFILEDKKWGDNPRGPEILSSGIVVSSQQWASVVTLGEWHTVRIEFDGNTSIICTIDGVVVGSSNTPPEISRSNDWTLTLGNFDGDIDEVYLTRSIIQDGADTTAPIATLTTPSSTVDGAFDVDIQFDESVTGLQLSDLIVTNGSASSLSGAGAGYSFSVTPVSAGQVSIQLAAGAVSDSAGNQNLASAILSVTYDDSPPPTGDDEYVPDANTVALYHLNTNFSDASINGLNLTATGNVQLVNDNLGWMNSPGGSVARFDTASDSLVVTIPDNLVLAEGDSRPLTIEARIYPQAWLGYSVDDLPIISLAQEWDTSLELQDSKWGNSPQGPRIVSAGIPLATASQWSTAAPLNAWSFLQISFDGNSTATAWINGQALGAVTIDPNFGRSNDWTLTLGNFRGDIDEVIVHRGSPTGAPIAGAAAGASAAVVSEALDGSGLDQTSAQMLADPDGDGYSNQVEVALGSDPLSADNIPDISIARDTEGRIELTFPTPDSAQPTRNGCETAGFLYVVETSENLVDWTPSIVKTLGTGNSHSGFRAITQRIEAHTSSNCRFVRVTVIAK